MKITLIELNRLTPAQIINFYSNIPLTENTLEIIGNFHYETRLPIIALFPENITLPARALAHLPRHVTTVKFSGEYAYSSRTSVNYDSNTNVRGERYGTSRKSYNREIGNLLTAYADYLPGWIKSLTLDFQHNDTFDDFFYGSSVPECLKNIFKCLRNKPHIQYLGLGNSELYEDYRALSGF